MEMTEAEKNDKRLMNLIDTATELINEGEMKCRCVYDAQTDTNITKECRTCRLRGNLILAIAQYRTPATIGR